MGSVFNILDENNCEIKTSERERLQSCCCVSLKSMGQKEETTKIELEEYCVMRTLKSVEMKLKLQLRSHKRGIESLEMFLPTNLSRIVGSAINILEELGTQLLKTFDRQQSCCCIIRVKNEETTKNEIERTLCCMIRKRGHNKVVGGDSCDTINLVSSTPTALKEK